MQPCILPKCSYAHFWIRESFVPQTLFYQGPWAWARTNEVKWAVHIKNFTPIYKKKKEKTSSCGSLFRQQYYEPKWEGGVINIPPINLESDMQSDLKKSLLYLRKCHSPTSMSFLVTWGSWRCFLEHFCYVFVCFHNVSL